MRFASACLNVFFLNFMFSLGRLSSDELSLNLDVFLGHWGPPYQTRRSLSFCYRMLDLVLLLIVDGLGPLLESIFYDFLYYLHYVFNQVVGFGMILVSFCMFFLCARTRNLHNLRKIIFNVFTCFHMSRNMILIIFMIFFATSSGIDF